MNVRLTHIDGKLPNLALMKLAHYHRAQGDQITFTHRTRRDMLEPAHYGRVYASAIFKYSAPKVAELRESFPDAVVGGSWNPGDNTTVETIFGLGGIGEYEHYDYSIYPGAEFSIGFTQRGCRLNCEFCGVPKKEGKPRSVSTIAQIWRGPPLPRHITLLDNDFFGQPRDAWEARIRELIDGKFKVCFNQGINIRMIDETSAAALASVKYHDDAFKVRRLYTAWDNLGHEKVFFKGVDTLEKHGIPATHLMVYMLLGFDPRETWERVMYRFNKMVARGIRPFPMVYDAHRSKTLPLGGCNAPIGERTLGEFQRWVIRKSYNFIPFEDYDVNAKGRKGGGGQGGLF